MMAAPRGIGLDRHLPQHEAPNLDAVVRAQAVSLTRRDHAHDPPERPTDTGTVVPFLVRRVAPEAARALVAHGSMSQGSHPALSVGLRMDELEAYRFGVSFLGSTNGFSTTVAATADPSGRCTVNAVPSADCATGTIAYPMFFSSRGEYIAEVM